MLSMMAPCEASPDVQECTALLERCQDVTNLIALAPRSTFWRRYCPKEPYADLLRDLISFHEADVLIKSERQQHVLHTIRTELAFRRRHFVDIYGLERRFLRACYHQLLTTRNEHMMLVVARQRLQLATCLHGRLSETSDIFGSQSIEPGLFEKIGEYLTQSQVILLKQFVGFSTSVGL